MDPEQARKLALEQARKLDLQQARKYLQQAASNPEWLQRITSSQPALGEALANKDENKVADVLGQLRDDHDKEILKKNELLKRLQVNEFDTEAQTLLEEMIRMKNIDESFEAAREHIPEAFGSVYMLYVPMELNGQRMQAFVDSGAQVTIMAKPCADRCNLTRLVDQRFDGVAKGVGHTKIVGRIHMTQIKLGSHFFQASFTVLEQEEPDIIFGLDLLRKFSCCINLSKNCLSIGGEDIPFLGEHEIKSGLGKTHSLSSSPKGGATRAPTPSNTRAQTDIDRLKVEQLTQLGFTEDQAKAALSQAQGNVDLAGSILFNQFEGV
eukprot:GHVN01034649.1.p1 GENE.GHVN01034649.1~~GHVN01034649.1.p1  ORF type:complete len:323 (-),score=45.42 GHVN01034649.1:155-1123(-)